MDKIVIKGARENNLKNIDIEIPKNKLVVMTGVSGSGKSSLAFDTIYNEGQRRYIESLSAYARQFLGNSDKPDVDSIDGLSPAISIDQKTTNRNPRSTVGTVTEIYDYLRLLFARVGVATCPTHHVPIKGQTIDEMVERILKLDEGTKFMITAPLVEGKKGTHQNLFEDLRKQGFTRVIVNDTTYDLNDDIEMEKNKKDTISVVIDRIIMKEDIKSRLYDSIETALKLSKGKVLIDVIDGDNILMSEHFACHECDFTLSELSPRVFSFNAPFGACPACKGLGFKQKIDLELLIPDKNKSIKNNGIVVLSTDNESNIYYQKLLACAKHYNIDITKKIKDMDLDELDILLYGSHEPIKYNITTSSGNKINNTELYEGVIGNLERRYIETNSSWMREYIESFMNDEVCEVCNGARLKDEVLAVLINQKNIYDVTKMSIGDCKAWFDNLTLNETEKKVGELVIKEIQSRLSFLVNVGLDYLSLNRYAATLSGGESQRIRLATQIGSKLSGVLYVLDEPSIGLHQRDNERLINTLKNMRDLGNSVLVVEHDHDTMLASDYLIDIGPGAGDLGGSVVSKGTPTEVMNDNNSLTGKYLSGVEKIDIPKVRRKGNKKKITIKGATENNLKNIDVSFPLGKFICVTGVSGSGKSTLVNEILKNAINNNLYRSKEKIGAHKSIKGIEHIDKMVDISQDPIGKTPRSNPATYVSVFDHIRDVFTETKEAKIRGYEKGRFSFNVKGGRCEACRGDGVKKIEMHFLPDVYVPCEVCKGTRYNSETLQIKFKDKNIYDVLNMRVSESLEFFKNVPKVLKGIESLNDVGLSYVKLGQSAPTLSGGEAARVKLAKELQKKPTGKSLFILDEPSTGLHIHDIKKLLVILNRIVDNGDTVIVIEHNLDIIKVADHIIDLGPEGGDKGGQVIFTGTPEEICECKESHTGKFLKEIM